MKRNVLIVLICASFLFGCQREPDPADDDVVLVLVDGQPITLPMLELTMRAHGVDEQDHERMRELLDDLIRMRAVAGAAERETLSDRAEVRAERQLRDMEVLYRRYIDHMQRQHPVTDEDVEEVYRQQHERAGDTHYRIETITYPEQAEALRVLAAIDDGESDYHSVRAEARERDLSVEQPGWIDLSQVPEDFASVLEGRAADSVVPLPLDTPQGWRVVKVLETRALEVPPLEQVREGIVRSLLQQRRRALIEDLYEQAEIEPMLPLDEERDDP